VTHTGIGHAQLTVVGVARRVSDCCVDVDATGIVVGDMDHRLCLIAAARLLNALCEDLARYLDCDANELLREITHHAGVQRRFLHPALSG
jgi:hypothetical protein